MIRSKFHGLLLLLALIGGVQAAELNEAGFRSWMSSISIDGKRFHVIEKDGAALNAMFINPARPEVGGRMVSLAPLKSFLDYQKMLDNPKMRMGPTYGFVFQGMRTVVVDTQSEIGIMAVVEAKNINRTFVLSFPPKTNQAAIEAALLKTGLYQK